MESAAVFQLKPLDALVISARYCEQRFAWHAHDDYAIGLIDDGALAFDCEGRGFLAPAGTICLVNPGEIHNGRSGSRNGWRYWNSYLPSALVGQIAPKCWATNGEPRFSSTVVRDEDTARLLRDFFHAVETQEDLLLMEERLIAAVALLLERYAQVGHQPGLTSSRIVRTAQEYMRANLSQPLSLADLAEATGVTGFHVVRVFKSVIGMSPYAWLVQLRAETARRLLLTGLGVAEVAAASGFSDQPHLTRWFKRVFGVTPGQIAVMSRSFKTPKSG